MFVAAVRAGFGQGHARRRNTGLPPQMLLGGFNLVRPAFARSADSQLPLFERLPHDRFPSRKAPPVFFKRHMRACASADFQLNLQQREEQRRPLALADLAKKVLNERIPPCPPIGLEPVTKTV